MLDARFSIKKPALIQYPASSIGRNTKRARTPQTLRNKKDFVRVRILHFRSRREAFHIDIFARRVRTLDQVRFARNWNSIRIVSFCDLRRWCGCWWRWSCCGLHGWRTCRLSRAVRIERLLRWRVLFGLGRAITRGPVSGRWRLRLFTA
jgi:hypothetical protein